MATASSSLVMKPWPRGGGDQQLAARHMHEHGDDVGFGRQVDEAADGLAIAAPARQLGAVQREEAAIGGEQHDLVGGLGMEPEAGAVAFAVFVVLGLFLVALQRPQPALGGADHGDGFLRHGVGVFLDMFGQRRHLGDFGGLGDFGAALAQRGLAAELGVDLAQFVDQLFAISAFRTPAAWSVPCVPWSGVMLAADFHFFQLAQGRAAAC